MRALLLAFLVLPGCYLSHQRPEVAPECDGRPTFENVDVSRTIPVGGPAQVGRFRLTSTAGAAEGTTGAHVALEGVFGYPAPATLRVFTGVDAPETLLFESEIRRSGDIFPDMTFPLSDAGESGGHFDLFVMVETVGLTSSMQMRVIVTTVLFSDSLDSYETCGEPAVGSTMTFVVVGECRLGETRHCYSGVPATEGVGRCHGSEHTCVLGPYDIPMWDQAPPDCVGEVTPYPWGDILTGDGIGVDDDCDGEVDEFDFYFCGEFGPSSPPEVFGHTGCCTRAAFMTRSDVPPSGTLVKGSTRNVYFLSEDGTRHVFPTSLILASWYQEPGVTTLAEHGPVICSQVVELPDDVLASIPLSGVNVTFRPGSVTTGIESIPDVRYAVTQGAILREMHIDYRLEEVCPVRVDSHHLTWDGIFGNYRLGAPITSFAEYDACREADTTLEEELARRAP